MTRWQGPSGRSWKLFIGVSTTLLMVPMVLSLLIVGPVPLVVLMTVLAPVAMGALYWSVRRIAKDIEDMVFRDTWLPVKELGTVIKRALEEAGIPYEGPFTRPPPDLLHNWIQWEVRIPDEGMRVAVMAGGTQGSVVLVGPATLYNATEVERLKRPIDAALEGPHHHKGVA